MWGILLLVLRLLGAAHCDIRARDPEVEEGEWDRSVLVEPVCPLFHLHRNWCTFVHYRTVTTAVHFGTERYTVKSFSPCPSGSPNCQLVLYKLSVRPVYKQQQRLVSSLLWRCCLGHGGPNCEDTVEDGRPSEPPSQSSGGAEAKLSEAHGQGVEKRPFASGDPNLGKRDNQPPRAPVGDTQRPTPLPPDRNLPDGAGGGVTSTMPLPQAAAALMAHIQPVLDGFGRTLSRLSREVEGLSRGLAELQREGRGPGGAGGGHALETRLRECAEQISQMRELLNSRSSELEERLNSQNAAQHLHMTAFKANADASITQSQDRLQSLNESVAEVRLRQQQLEKVVKEAGGTRTSPNRVAPNQAGPNQGQPGRGAGVWEAISRLEVEVANNTRRLAALEEGSDRASQQTRSLWRGLRGLEERIVRTGQRTKVRFSATSQEVEGDRVAVMGQVEEMAGNLTASDVQLEELDSDLDYLYNQLHSRHSPAPDCDCGGLVATLARLEQEVANATDTARGNRLVLEDHLRGQGRRGTGPGASLDDLQERLLLVRDSLSLEQERTQALRLDVSRLEAEQAETRRKLGGLLQRHDGKGREIHRLSSYFSSLLEDAVRHAEVLEVLLGEEVLEFTERPSREQEEYSIPLLQDKIRLLQEQTESQAQSLATVNEGLAGDEPSAGQSERLSRVFERRSSEDHMDDPFPDSPSEDGPEDYSVSDFWSMGREVEELESRLSQLERRPCPSCCNCTAAPAGPEVQPRGEGAALHRALEEHLRTFWKELSDEERPAGSDTMLDLDAPRATVSGKEAPRQRRQRKERRDQHSPRTHRHRAAAGVSQFSEAPLAFLASTYSGTNRTGALIFEAVSLNHGGAYSPRSGVFRAPEAGLYLFLLNLDFGPGTALAILRTGGAPLATLRRGARWSGGPVFRACLLELGRGARVHLELARGTLRRGGQVENTFAGVLLFRTT
ncbi:multimerin-2-like [Megalops cyprinoides]|uniref:multimerin-2-like n=1 Tax=Megalops cyprinoides TaxID=118141 RepID=UPI001864FEB3|nr:multimerin-2-like [Megalops cyprinoides]